MSYRGTLFRPPHADMSEDEQWLWMLKKQKKDFDYMTCDVLKEQQKHLLASLHFKAVYNHIMFLPSIGITLFTGILAVIAQSNLGSDIVSILTMSISILSTCSVFWQSLIKQLDYGGRAAMHDSTATALTHLFKLANFRSRESKSSIDDNSPNNAQQSSLMSSVLKGREEGASASAGATDQESSDKSNELPFGAVGDHFSLSQQFEQAIQGCTSIVPIQITAAFNVLESRISVSNRKLITIGTGGAVVSWERVYPALFYELTLTIIGSWGWPYMVPSAEWAVDKTINDFRKMDGCMLSALVSRAKEINDEYVSLTVNDDPSNF